MEMNLKQMDVRASLDAFLCTDFSRFALPKAESSQPAAQLTGGRSVRPTMKPATFGALTKATTAAKPVISKAAAPRAARAFAKK